MRRLIPAFILLISFAASAADVYFAQTSQGSDTGVDAANAHSVSWLNTYGNQIPVNTYHVVGTITTAVTLTNNITLKFESSSKFSAGTWTSDVVTVQDNCTVDGNGVGIIEATANGTGMASQNDFSGIYANSANSVTVKSLTIRKLYVRTRGTEQNDYCTAIRISPTAPRYGFTNLLVTNCVLSDMYIGVSMNYASGGNTNLVVCNNVISNVNWGVQSGDETTSGRLAQVDVHHNRIGNFANWDDTSVNSFHHNGVFVWAQQTGSTVGLVNVHHNYVYGYGTYNTSGFYFEANYSLNYTGPVNIYNNIFNDPDNNPSNGSIFFKPNDGFVGNVHNNTVVGNGYTDLVDWDCLYGGTQTVNSYNNVVSNAIAFAIYNNAPAVIHSDYNSFYTLPGFGAWFSWSSDNSAASRTLASWQSIAGNDTHSITNNPDYDANLVPNSTSPLIGAGTNLYSIFTTDYRDTNRVSSGAWDIGANTYTAGSGGRRRNSVKAGSDYQWPGQGRPQPAAAVNPKMFQP